MYDTCMFTLASLLSNSDHYHVLYKKLIPDPTGTFKVNSQPSGASENRSYKFTLFLKKTKETIYRWKATM